MAAPPELARGPLAGIRVLDLATMLAGPYAATLLGDLGADVIKVESFVGDDSRHLGPRRGGQRTSFLSLNRNKRALAIDLRQAGARAVFGRLAASSDVLITNIREPALSNLGVDYDSVRAHAPNIVWIGVTAFGPDGPYAGRPGIDFLAQGYAGLLAMNGRPGDEPVRVTVPVIDVMTSELVCTSSLAALIALPFSGSAQEVDDSMRIILVAGATGTQGGAVARELAARGYRVRGLTRNPDSEASRELTALGIEMVRGDFDDAASLDRALEDAYGAFSVQQYRGVGVDGGRSL